MTSHSHNNNNVPAWLFCWHPYHWTWEALALAIQRTAEGGSVVQRWHCHSDQVSVGDRVWLMRQGVEPQGIMAIGSVIKPPYEAEHYDKTLAKQGKRCCYVDIAFTQILDVFKDRFILLSELSELNQALSFWENSQSGIRIDVGVAKQLDTLWDDKAKNIQAIEYAPKSNSGKKVESESQADVKHIDVKNVIFYGPPGTGKTHALREQQASYVETVNHQPMAYYEFVTFHQAYSYEDFVEGIRPVHDEQRGVLSYHLVPGVFKRLCAKAKADPTKRYAIFIDEINRGNIARIFGELITLIEVDKRAVYNGDGLLVHGVELTLPYSGQLFGVPRNVDIYGSMNTADRSIAVLDAALRRRFMFKALEPNVDLIAGARQNQAVTLPAGIIADDQGGEIDLRALLRVINQRLGLLLHRDMLLGHAYFFHVTNFSELKHVLLEQVIPLLQEYFYNDWQRIQLVFRDISINQEKIEPQIIQHHKVNAREILGFDVDELNQTVEYRIVAYDALRPEAIRKVYQHNL